MQSEADVIISRMAQQKPSNKMLQDGWKNQMCTLLTPSCTKEDEATECQFKLKAATKTKSSSNMHQNH